MAIKKKALIISILIITPIVIFLLFMKIMTHIMASERPLPENLKAPRIFCNKLTLKSKIITNNTPLSSDVCEIQVMNLPNQLEPNIVITCGDGALIMDLQGKIERQINFDWKRMKVSSPILYTTYFDTKLNEFVFSLWDISHFVGTFDQKNNILWRYDKFSHFPDAFIDDLDDKGRADYLIIRHPKKPIPKKGIPVIHFKNGEQQPTIYAPSGTVCLDVADINGDGQKEVVFPYERGKFTKFVAKDLLDRKIPIDNLKVPTIYKFYGFIRYPETNNYYCCMVRDNTSILYDLDGRIFKNLRSPEIYQFDPGRFRSFRYTLGKFSSNSGEYLALFVKAYSWYNRQFWDRGMLYIYNQDGDLVYQELFGAQCRSACFLDPSTSGLHGLLVGVGSNLYLYSLPENNKTKGKEDH